MKILMASDAFYPKVDGVVTYLKNAIPILTSKGHKVVLLCSKYDYKYREVRIPGARIIRFSSFSLPSYKEAKFAMPNLKKIQAIFKRFKPDVVHIHTPGPLGIMTLLFAKRAHVPIVNTYHTSLPDSAIYLSPKRFFNLDEAKSERLDVLEKKLRNLQKRILKIFRPHKSKEESVSIKAIWAIIRMLYNPSDRVIAPSPNIEKELKKHKIRSKITVISNGIELDLFKKKNSYNKVPKFLHVGRLGVEKKIDVVINAMAAAIKTHPEATLSIIGDGPARDSLVKLTRRLHVEKNVKFYGYIDRTKLPLMYRRHDVFVTASEFETQGLVLIEAMASGLPVIGVKVLAIPDVVHPGVTGFLAGRGNSKEIAKYICLMIENPDLVKALGNNARKESEMHDINKCMKRMETLYKEIIYASQNHT